MKYSQSACFFISDINHIKISKFDIKHLKNTIPTKTQSKKNPLIKTRTNVSLDQSPNKSPVSQTRKVADKGSSQGVSKDTTGYF